jgi:hypothetical protein
LQLTFYNVTVEAGTRPLMAHSVGWYWKWLPTDWPPWGKLCW